MKDIIQKATENGWIPKVQYLMMPEDYVDTIIFSPEFLKAFFGEKEVEIRITSFISNNHNLKKNIDKITYNQKAWQYHAQQMVVLESREERVQYLRGFVK